MVFQTADSLTQALIKLGLLWPFISLSESSVETETGNCGAREGNRSRKGPRVGIQTRVARSAIAQHIGAQTTDAYN